MIPINKRKIGISILLSIVTFGIYQIYWEYLLVKNTRAIKKDKSSCVGEMLCLIFVPFYPLYWWFTRGEIVKDKFTEHSYSAVGKAEVYLILGIFGLSIVSMAIMQNDFNSLTSEHSQSIQQSTKKKPSDKAIMRATRIVLIAISLIGMVIAWNEKSVIFTIVSFAWAGFGATFGPTMLFSLFWKRTNQAGAVAGMITGGVMVFVWKLCIRPLGGVFDIYELLPAFLLSSLVIVVVSLLTAPPSEEVQKEFEAVKQQS